MKTRVFRRKGQKKPTSLTLSLSFPTKARAVYVADAVDQLKAWAAVDGVSMSEAIGRALCKAADAKAKS